MNKKVTNSDEYIVKHPKWQQELIALRNIIQKTEMEETIKWGAPTYTVNGKNVVGLAAFKNHFTLWFFNGVFLKDKHKKLVNAQEGTTKALRQWRFEKLGDIEPKIIKEYLEEAIGNEKAGKKITSKKNTKPVEVPKELETALKSDKDVQKAFKSLSVSCQREYANHIAEAKRDETKHRRIEKILPMIKNGGGLHDKYKNC